ncbi:hypothetical protein C8R45DRAFT_1044676 [Mycena sanguinolenta]|nr:hypothetical protein C8R45DRAFT_1044676 [Mycena sanguinolenta]
MVIRWEYRSGGHRGRAAHPCTCTGRERDTFCAQARARVAEGVLASACLPVLARSVDEEDPIGRCSGCSVVPVHRPLLLLARQASRSWRYGRVWGRASAGCSPHLPPTPSSLSVSDIHGTGSVCSSPSRRRDCDSRCLPRPRAGRSRLRCRWSWSWSCKEREGEKPLDDIDVHQQTRLLPASSSTHCTTFHREVSVFVRTGRCEWSMCLPHV